MEKPAVMVFRPEDKHAWQLMPELLERIIRFPELVPEAEMDHVALARSFTQHFVCGSPALAALGVVPTSNGERQPRLIGHILWEIQESYGDKSLVVLQYVLDKGVPRETHQEGMRVLEEVGKANGCSSLIAACPSEAVARVHRMYHGFERYATLMRRRLEVKDGRR